MPPTSPRAARRSRPATARRQPGGGLWVLAFVVSAVLYLLFAPGSHSDAAAPAAPKPVSVLVPELAGTGFDQAEQRLRELGHRADTADGLPYQHDLSPLGRVRASAADWTVAATRPAAGQRWEVGRPIYVFVLRAREWQWFAAHPTMPPVPAGTPAADLSATAEFADVAELLEFGQPAKYQPEFSIPMPALDHPPVAGLGDDPSAVPAAELAARQGLSWVSESSRARTLSSVPRAGTRLRVGQLLTVTVGAEPRSPGGGGGAGGGFGGGHDDFNIPGWACPTRFC